MKKAAIAGGLRVGTGVSSVELRQLGVEQFARFRLRVGEFDPPGLQFDFNGLWFDAPFTVLKF